MACDCDACRFTRRYEQEVEKLPEESREYFTDILGYIIGLEEDKTYYELIVKNKWPSADEVLAFYRDNIGHNSHD